MTSFTVVMQDKIVTINCIQGWEIVHRVGFSILEMARDQLMTKDMEGMLKVRLILYHFQEFMVPTWTGKQ